MDPISMIETALVAGAAASSKDVASQAIKDAYNGLKKGVERLFANQPKAQVVLEEHENDPESHEKALKKWLGAAHAGEDTEVRAAAEQVLLLVQPLQAGVGKFTAQNNAVVQGQTIGDGNTIAQHFGMLRRKEDGG